MKRPDSHDVAVRSQKRLALNRETLRRLEAKELEQAAGGVTGFVTCSCGSYRGDI